MNERGSRPTIVLKLGSSILRDDCSFVPATHEVYRWVRRGYRVVAVVSAVGGTTDALLARAKRVCDEPEPFALAGLLATGEQASAALFAAALHRAGVPCRAFDAASLGLSALGDPLDATPAALDAGPIRGVLDAGCVAVVPGFVGVDGEGRTVLLGRGGSDLTALVVADALGARCRLLKDTGAVFDSDPALNERARPYTSVSFDDAVRLEGRIVQNKAAVYAREHEIDFEVAAPFRDEATRVCGGPTTLLERKSRSRVGTDQARPIGVALLGLGVVNGGVLEALLGLRGADGATRGGTAGGGTGLTFDVRRIAVRDVERHIASGVACELLTTDPWELLETDADVIVEAVGGGDSVATAYAIVSAALRDGRHVVSANKALVAAHGRELSEIAESHGVRFAYSACVGGGVPAIESVRRVASEHPIREVSGVLNGTCNFVLERLGRGASLDEAVTAAQARGLAEADPSADLAGLDVAHKLIVIAREAFGVDLDLAAVVRQPIDHSTPELVRLAQRGGATVRQVARVTRTRRGVEASVVLELLPASDPLAQVAGAGNRVRIDPIGGGGGTGGAGSVLVHGAGAGRWPTTQSILSDLLEIAGTFEESPARVVRACRPEAVFAAA